MKKEIGRGMARRAISEKIEHELPSGGHSISWRTKEYEEGICAVFVDADALIHRLGTKAMNNKRGRSRLANGAIEVRTISRIRYQEILDRALAMMEAEAELEPTSALKAAANEVGIPWGDAMGFFVSWARKQMEGEPS